MESKAGRAENLPEEEGEAGKAGDSLLTHLLDLTVVVALAVAFALAMRIFLFQPFNIPSGSMKPTLLVGDYLVISKYSYGFSRYSFPFNIRLFEGRMLAKDPERGDVVVFHRNKTDYIKRVVGLPGDRIQMREGRLFINEKEVQRRSLAPFNTSADYGFERDVLSYEERLPNGRKYRTLDLNEDGANDNTPVYLVPEGHFFMMGDNRDNSMDSRVNSPIGFVPRENLIGKAQFVYFSRQKQRPGRARRKGDGQIRWSRLLTPIR